MDYSDFFRIFAEKYSTNRTMLRYKNLAVLCMALLCVAGMQAAKTKKVFVNKDLHIIPAADRDGAYAQLTYHEDHILADVYNSRKMLILKLRLSEISEDTIVYDGLQRHYFYNELRDLYLYEQNKLLEHVRCRDGKPIFKEPLAVGDTIWFAQGFVVMPEEANAYGVVTDIDENSKVYTMRRYDKSDNALETEGRFSKISYEEIRRTGRHNYYRDGKRYKTSVYSSAGKLLEEFKVDTMGKVTQRIVFEQVSDNTPGAVQRWKEKKYFYPSGKLRAEKVREGDETHVRMYNEEGVEVESTIDEEEPGEKEDFVPEQMPCYPGGSSGLFQYLSENVRYPVRAQEMGLSGRVEVSFVVDKDGTVVDAIVVRPVHKLLNDEALRVIRKMRKWQPGTMNGKPVRVRYTVPVAFRLY